MDSGIILALNSVHDYCFYENVSQINKPLLLSILSEDTVNKPESCLHS
jgi:hypothetical protein